MKWYIAWKRFNCCVLHEIHQIWLVLLNRLVVRFTSEHISVYLALGISVHNDV